MLNSIRLRLSASYVVLTLLTVAVIGSLTVGMVSRQIRAEEEASLTTQARLIAEQAFHYFLPGPQPDLLRELSMTSAVVGNLRVRILDTAREAIADSRVDYAALRTLLAGSRGARLPARSPYAPVSLEAPAAAASTALRWRITSIAAESMSPTRRALGTIVSTVPVGGAASPLGYVEVSRPSGALSAGDAARTAVGLAALGAVLVAAALGVLMSQGMTMSLRALSLAAKDLGGGNLSARVPVRGPEEISQLSSNLNRMATQLEAGFAALSQERDTLRRFVADASHELRTPLTALITFNELLRNAAASDERAREEFLDESKRQLERLEWITRSLLILSRLEAGLVEPELETCDAVRLMVEVSASWARAAVEGGITLRVEEPAAPITSRCDRGRVQIALSNLLSNAIKFTPRGGSVTVSVARVGDGVRYEVTDTGPGVPEAERERIFDRFYRGLNARGAGSGLGLAIVKSVAVLHGGQVSVRPGPGGGSHFRLDLPAWTWLRPCGAAGSAPRATRARLRAPGYAPRATHRGSS